MTKAVYSKMLLAITMCIAVAACGRDAAAPEASTTPAPDAAPAVPGIVPPATETAVARVESVMVSRPQEAPHSIRIQASGIVGTRGWSGARLVPIENVEGGKTRSFNLVAMSPATGQGAGPTEIVEAELQLDMLPNGTEMIRVVGATNEVSAFMP